MGSILQFFDLNQANTSRKLMAQKRHVDGLEAPRNSLEFSFETSQSYNVIQEDIPYSCQVKQHSSKMNFCPNGAPMKKLINEELSKRTTNRSNTPSVVARLMGMDTLPSETKPTIHAKEWKDENPRSTGPRKGPTEMISGHHRSSLSSTPIKKTRQDLLPHGIRRNSSQSTNSLRLTKLQPREHPQEELLQKFKKEFEAWQASKVWERSRTLEVDNYFRQEKVNQILAQENLKTEKMARYRDSKRDSAHKKPTEPKGYVSTAKLKTNMEQGDSLRHEGYVIGKSQANLRDDMANNFTRLAVTKFDEKQNRSSSPTRIVILKPSSERSDDFEESWSGSPEIMEKEVSMRDFLEEVKERLKSEMLGKVRNNSTAREISTETSFSERPGDTKQFARHIAKQIRESVTRDLGTTLIRSESTRSYRSEFKFNGPDFPEFINRDTRKLLSERLKNVLRNETDVEIPLVTNGRSRTMKGKVKSQSMHDFSKLEKKVSYLEDKKTLTESKARFFRGEQEKDAIFEAEQVSPRNLVRSFSAPVSGTAFGKLLLEDQHVLTGAHIHRKHEASELPSPESRRKRKDGFNLKSTVTNLRQNFTLKGKLFGKKTQMVDESAAHEFDSVKAIVTPQSAIGNFGIVQDNSTEVPPSPASVSSSSLDDFCRPGHPSPVSPLQALFIEDHSAPKVSREISSVLLEPRNLSSEQVEHDVYEEVAVEGKSNDETVEVEGHAEAYLRDILITAGLYEGEAFDEAFPKWDAATKPISKWVFEEVEEAYSKKGKLDDGASLCCYGDINLSHKMLFDLINEALPRVLKTPTTSSTFKKWVLGPNIVSHGKKLLDDLWHQIQVYTTPRLNESNSVDSMVAQDLTMTSWFSVLHEDRDVIGREMEWVILGDLINEFVWEICPLIVHGMRW